MDSSLLTTTGWSQFLSRAEQTVKDAGHDIPLEAWQDELGRLRIWASDAGIHDETRREVLEEHLSRYPFIKKQVLRQLARVERLMRDLEDRVYSQYEDESESSLNVESETEPIEEGQPETAIQDIFMNLADSISGLNRMSTIFAQRTNMTREQGIENTVNVEEEQPTPSRTETWPMAESEYSTTTAQDEDSRFPGWICCSCCGGPHILTLQPRCIMCNHRPCHACIYVG
ncbi:hypothetical protein BDV18DRAFT_132133 [Aspergillus unguis]